MPAVDLSSLPSVDRLLAEPRISALIGLHSRAAVAGLARTAIERARRHALDESAQVPTAEEIVIAVLEDARSRFRPWPAPVVNATGVILHTNLGRAPLSEAAIAAAAAASAGYSDLEFDLQTGKRGSRNRRISQTIADATGAQAGLAVNNNASAVLLVLAALAGEGQEVIVSRGEAVEIGGGFRVPDVLRQSGAILVEVGTTNKTYVSDYANAITPRTAAVLKVHPSNFTVSGFTHVPDLVELVSASRERNVPVLNDLGSGTLIPTERFGLAHEPLVQESVVAGVGLTMFSGDKLLGGPQAGLIAGSRDLMDIVIRHPLARALRADKVTLAALAATLGSYIRGVADTELPVWRMISAKLDDLRERAASWKAASGIGGVIDSESAIGGGSLPGQTLPSVALAIDPRSGADDLAARLRLHSPAVIGRVEDGRVLLDPRTVDPHEDEQVVDALKESLR